MAEDTKLILAEKVFDQLWKAYDRRDIEFERGTLPLRLTAYQTTRGGQYLEIFLEVDAERMQIRLDTQLDIEIPENRRCDMAACVCVVNGSSNEGVFRYDIVEGRILYCMTRYYEACELTDSFLTEMYFKAGMTVDEFYGEFSRLADGSVSRDELLRELKEKKHHKWAASEDYENTAESVFNMLALSTKMRGCKIKTFPRMKMYFIDFPSEDKTVGLMVRFDVEEQYIEIASPFEVSVKTETAEAFVQAACEITDNLLAGGICFNYPDGSIFYRITDSFLDGSISSEVFYRILETCADILRFCNRKFKKINNGEC